MILDFDEQSARESAEQDWKIDIQREAQERKQAKAKNKDLGAIEEIDSEESSSDEEEGEYLTNEEREEIEQRRALREQRRQAKIDKLNKLGIDYERLTEFFFDLCLSWCQYLDIETFLFFINGVFLNITKGAHINVSVFKELEEIEVLSIEFINHLLAYRSVC